MNAEAKSLAIKAQAPLEIGDVPAMTPMTMLDRAVTSGANIETIEKLMGLQERWEANQARKAFDNAMAEAKAHLPAIVKTREGHNYKYEDLSEIARLIDPVLAEHGLSYHYETESNGEVKVTCVICHRDGHSKKNSLSSKPDTSGSKNSIQAIGSAVTYLQRYTLKAALGLAAARDDDSSTVAATITEDEAKAFHKLVDDLGAVEEKLCAFVGAESVEAMTSVQLKKATVAVNEWAKAQRKGK